MFCHLSCMLVFGIDYLHSRLCFEHILDFDMWNMGHTICGCKQYRHLIYYYLQYNLWLNSNQSKMLGRMFTENLCNILIGNKHWCISLIDQNSLPIWTITKNRYCLNFTIVENVPKHNLSFIGTFIYENMYENYRKLHQYITCTKYSRKIRCMYLKSENISKIQLIRLANQLIFTHSPMDLM